jgi:phosphatidylglycerol:prolipoprotein diacylglycerol transferase
MLPYLTAPSIPIGSLRIYPFGILVAAGIVTGIAIVAARSSKAGCDPESAVRLSAVAVLCGLPGSWILREAFFTGRGIYSFGGVVCGLAGAACYLQFLGLRREKIWNLIDLLSFAFPFGLALGRAGCALAHDHPGIGASNWLAVRYPGGGRYDLGLIEFLFLLAVIALFLWLDRKPRPAGFFCGLFFGIYGPFRFLLDSLHEPGVPRFLLTPDQWFGLASTIGGTLVLWRVLEGVPGALKARVFIGQQHHG